MTEAAMDDWGFDLHALYRIYDAFGRPLYFGETDNLPRRLAQHMEKAWFRRPDITIKVTWFPNRAEALAAETSAIAAEKPWHNKAGLKIAPNPKTPARSPRPPRDILSDVANAIGEANGLHWQTIAERLGTTAGAVSAQCRALGIPTVQIWTAGRNRQGCRRADVEAAIRSRQRDLS